MVFCGLPDAALEALANMSDLDKDFDVSEQDDHISGEENDYENFDSEAYNDDARDGVRDTYIKENILIRDTNTTLDNTLEMALALEAVDKQNLEEYNTNTST
ncbi:hypothetical protein FQA39_LY04910 [Lamprigera yunnana]|nr:hypothetical protein FQA39_LY04910 [Lamprigera yunnana]